MDPLAQWKQGHIEDRGNLRRSSGDTAEVHMLGKEVWFQQALEGLKESKTNREQSQSSCEGPPDRGMVCSES